MTKAERRAEVREVVRYLRSDLYERDRDYSFQEGSKAYTCELGPVEHDANTGMLWGSPLGWRVLITVEDNGTGGERLTLGIFDRPGKHVRSCQVGCGGGVAWLETYLP